MSGGRYAPVPNPLTHDAEREMDAAFQSDDDEEELSDDERRGETTPLNPNPRSTPSPPPLTPETTTPNISNDGRINSPHPHHHNHQRRQTVPGAYDFETDPFDYAVPPPGSPPRPSVYAHPNQYGNNNGIIPSNPIIPPAPSSGSSNIFRRAVGALLPSYYQRVPTSEAGYSVPARGGGTNNDGVFANLTAKPSL